MFELVALSGYDWLRPTMNIRIMNTACPGIHKLTFYPFQKCSKFKLHNFLGNSADPL
jgi:hypothetical protein